MGHCHSDMTVGPVTVSPAAGFIVTDRRRRSWLCRRLLHRSSDSETGRSCTIAAAYPLDESARTDELAKPASQEAISCRRGQARM